MFESIQTWTTSVLESHINSPLLLLAIFVLGFTAAVGSCCNLGVMGAIAGYSGTQSTNVRGNSKPLLSAALFFTLGNIISLSIIGALTGFISQAVGSLVGQYWKIIGGIVTVYFGLVSLGLLPFSIPKPQFLSKNINIGKLNGLVFGLAMGGFATACSASCSPIFAVVLGISYLQGDVLWSWLTLFVFSLGYSIPLSGVLVGLGLGFNKVSSTLLQYSNSIKYVSGSALILVGFGLLIGGV